MNIIFTMAGQYSRFRLYGAKVRKYLPALGQGTIMSNVISGVIASAPTANLYLTANQNDQLFYPIIKTILNSHGLPVERISSSRYGAIPLS